MRVRLYFLFVLGSFFSCEGQQPVGTNLLKLEKEIAMPDVKGRIDHMAVNLKNQVLYVAALGNNTVEVIDLAKAVSVKSIKGVEEPQGIAYLPEQNEIAVASGATGDCVFFNASTFEKLATIHLNGDADNVRYDAAAGKIYVGYGNGGLALIDPATHKQIGSVKLPAHPESFQLDKKNNRLYVNVPDDNSISVIDLKRFVVIDEWKTGKYKANFPMTLDTANNLVIVGFRHPATLVSYNALNGHLVSAGNLISDVDDIFYYPARQEVIASGGGGSINLFKAEKNMSYQKLANIPSRDGARTSLLIPSLKTFIVAERATGGRDAAVAVYTFRE